MPSKQRPSKPDTSDSGFVVPNLRTKKHKKSVNVGVQGQTPKKIITYTDRKVDVGISKGETPIKRYEYDSREAVIDSMKFSPEKRVNNNIQALRPKTSRGKAHPSPDEFFDYVVPSPMNLEKFANKQSKFVVFNEDENVEYRMVDSDRNQKKNNKLQLNEAKAEQIRMLGCWLFGSALKV